MKKVSLIIILILVLAGLITLTTYTLTHKEIKGEQEIRKTKKVEQASSNMTSNELSEIYNVELNGKRHKLKSNYFVTFKENKAQIDLKLYLDGFEILNIELANDLKAATIEEIFTEDETTFPKIETENIMILSTDQDYLLIEIDSKEKREYYVWNDQRNNILENILVYDEKIVYESTNEEELTFFYDDTNQILAKVEDDVIYALEQEEVSGILILQEYAYKIEKNEAVKELINTYENIKLKETEK